MASLADVAKAAGVSVTTASFVLNGHASSMRISPQTAARVLEAVRELGYVPNVAAKKLTNASDRNAVIPDVAFMWSDNLHHSVISSYITYAREFFHQGKVPQMNIIIAPFSPKEILTPTESFLNRHYNGVVFSPMYDNEVEYVNNLSLQIPLVVIHTRTSRFPNVVVDNLAVGRLAARAFHAGGHRSAAMVYRVQIGETSLEDDRVVGFRNACEEFGMEFTGTMLPRDALVSLSSRARFGKSLAEEYLAEGALPEAIFIQDDAVATGFVVRLLQAGVRIPEDIEIITYGADDLVDAIVPSITTVNYPAAGITLESLKLLNGNLSDPYALPTRVSVATDITFRDSCPMPKGWKETE